MSWSFAFHGKRDAVRKRVAAESVNLPIAQEGEAFNSAKQAILHTLECWKADAHVFVSASGSASRARGGELLGGQVQVSVSNAPVVPLATYVGELCEEQSA